MLNFMLQEIVNHWRQGCEERSGQESAVFESLGIVASTGVNDTELPGQGTDEVETHGNIMREMIVRRCNVYPSTACNCAYNAD